MRSSGGTYFGLSLSVVASTNSMIAFLAGPSFHDGKRSAACARRASESTASVVNAMSLIRFMVEAPFYSLHYSVPGSGRPMWGARPIHHAYFMRLFACVTDRCGFLELLQDRTEVVALGRLQRRELPVRHEVLHPQLLPDRQHVPIVLERGHGGAERTSQAHR